MNCIAERGGPDAIAQAVLGNHIDRPAEEALEMHFETCQIEKGAPGVHCDQEIDVTFRAFLATRDGAEKP